jgi:hypothetical protein
VLIGVLTCITDELEDCEGEVTAVFVADILVLVAQGGGV